jgi:hypothetical protein
MNKPQMGRDGKKILREGERISEGGNRKAERGDGNLDSIFDFQGVARHESGCQLEDFGWR